MLVWAEWHSYTMQRYWTTVRPREQLLSERHLASGGKYLSLVLLREPMQHIISHFLMWPLNGLKGDQLAVKPFEVFLRDEAPGLQTRQLTLDGAPGSCDTELAMDRLTAFDLVCSVRLLATCLDVLATEFGLSERHSGTARTDAPHSAPASLTRDGAMWNASHDEVRKKTSSVVSYEMMRRAASCDQALMDREHEWMGPTRSRMREQRDRGVVLRSARAAGLQRLKLNASRRA